MTNYSPLIASGLKKLRHERKLSQMDLAKVLDVSQATLSLIESSKSVLTADQFLNLLQRYNLEIDFFVPQHSKNQNELVLQNALARFGAKHLRESDESVSLAPYKNVNDLILNILINPLSSRHLTALAPIAINQLHSIVFNHLFLELHKLGLERRLLWFLECLSHAIEKRLKDTLNTTQKKYYRLAQRIILSELSVLNFNQNNEVLVEDCLMRSRASTQVITKLKSKWDTVAQKWKIITDITSDDFYNALVETDEYD